MNKTQKTLAFISLVVGMLLTAFSIFNLNMSSVKAGAFDPKCTVSSTEVATVGNQLSSTLVSADEVRGYTRIQALPNSTSTIYLSFDEGAAAVLYQGASIDAATTTTNIIEFGRNTDFAYTGAVTGISTNGSTTVMVTSCSY